MPGGNIATDANFLQLVCNFLTKEMQNRLTNNQKIGRFNPNHPLDAGKFCDDLHRYWNIKFKDEKLTKDKNRNKEDNTNQQNSQNNSCYNNSGDRTDNNAPQAVHTGLRGRGGNHTGGDQGDRGHCSVIGHENHRYDWKGCHLNPYSRRYDAEAAQRFYENNVHGPNVWYRDIYESTGGQS